MKILIVDDSKGMRGVVRRALRAADIGDHFYEEAANGLDALRVISETTPDLVLTDWNMPGMSGLELIETLRDQGNKVRVAFITSEAAEDMRQTALDAGAEFVLTKPISTEAVKAAFVGLQR